MLRLLKWPAIFSEKNRGVQVKDRGDWKYFPEISWFTLIGRIIKLWAWNNTVFQNLEASLPF